MTGSAVDLTHDEKRPSNPSVSFLNTNLNIAPPKNKQFIVEKPKQVEGFDEKEWFSGFGPKRDK